MELDRVTVAHRWMLDEKKRRHLQVGDGAPGPEVGVHARQLDAALAETGT